MLFSVLFPLALGLHSSFAAAQPVKRSINWSPCTQPGTSSLTCSTLYVPLDYTDSSSNSTLKLQLVKSSAAKQPKKGSILINPGGPGSGGRDIVANRATELQIATGGEYDLIGFDPRYVMLYDLLFLLTSSRAVFAAILNTCNLPVLRYNG